MDFRNLLITGGAGFVGSNLAVRMRRRFPHVAVLCIDNLKRRGSELNLPRLSAAGVQFVHGDIRCPEDLAGLPEFDLLIDCAAEPSVHAGTKGSPRFVIETNLVGTINCLEEARQRGAAFLFLSTSRVYPIARLNALPFSETATRFRWESSSEVTGFSSNGISEEFPLEGARSLYGSSKLACELLIQEYVSNYSMRALINRCGVLSGPWQMGKVDQGVVALWVARHVFQRPLQYMGYGGTGKQVRDLLHVHDLFDLLILQMANTDVWDGRVYNVGGGNDVSVSLQELTDLCGEETGHRVDIQSVPETSAVDVRIFVTDARRVQRNFGWSPQRSPRQIVQDIHKWVDSESETLQSLFT